MVLVSARSIAALSGREAAIKSASTVPNHRIVLAILLVIVLFHTWLASYSREEESGRTTYYYAYLSEAFIDGHLHLSIQPDPRLLALDNPYDLSARVELEKQGVVTPVDFSLYEGKFYLYWGPAPSLLLALIQIPARSQPIADFFLAFVFGIGILLAQYFLLLAVWREHFSTLPAWTFYISLFLAGLLWPVALLRHENNHARIYEAAIAAGQFFLICGLWTAFTAITKRSIPNWRLALAGSCWVLAIGSRHLLIVPISLLVFLTMFWILRTQPAHITKMIKLIFLILPLAFGGTILACYNWARFDSITETGFSYALAGVDLQDHLNHMFSGSYIVQNLYNYSLNPPHFISDFPFVSMLKGSKSLGLPFYVDPVFYYVEPMTGLLYIFPFAIFAILPVIVFMLSRFKAIASNNDTENHDQRSLDWLALSLGSAFVASFLLLMIFFWAGMRYTADFLPSLTMLSAIGFWQGYCLFERRLPAQNYYRIAGIILAGISVVVSTLLAISTA